MKIYKFKNQYSIISGLVIAILCFTQVFWTLSSTKSGSNTVGFAFVFAATFAMIMDMIKHWNVVYKIDDEKITFIHNNGRSSTTMSWAEVVSIRCYGYSYVPLACKSLVITNGYDTIPLRMIGSKDYKKIWIYAYEHIVDKSKSVLVSDRVDKTIENIKKVERNNE